jgi:hypothetical protein
MAITSAAGQETKNDCAGGDHQQFSTPPNTISFSQNFLQYEQSLFYIFMSVNM